MVKVCLGCPGNQIRATTMTAPTDGILRDYRCSGCKSPMGIAGASLAEFGSAFDLQNSTLFKCLGCGSHVLLNKGNKVTRPEKDKLPTRVPERRDIEDAQSSNNASRSQSAVQEEEETSSRHPGVALRTGRRTSPTGRRSAAISPTFAGIRKIRNGQIPIGWEKSCMKDFYRSEWLPALRNINGHAQ